MRKTEPWREVVFVHRVDRGTHRRAVELVVRVRRWHDLHVIPEADTQRCPVVQLPLVLRETTENGSRHDVVLVVRHLNRQTLGVGGVVRRIEVLVRVEDKPPVPTSVRVVVQVHVAPRNTKFKVVVTILVRDKHRELVFCAKCPVDPPEHRVMGSTDPVQVIKLRRLRDLRLWRRGKRFVGRAPVQVLVNFTKPQHVDFVVPDD